jgi:hypothetical protein
MVAARWKDFDLIYEDLDEDGETKNSLSLEGTGPKT